MSKTALFRNASLWAAPALAELIAQDRNLVNARDSKGRTALHLCARRRWDGTAASARSSLATAHALLEAGAAINAVQEIADDGEIFPATALWYAVAWGRNVPLVKDLVRRGADPDNCLAAVVWADDAPMTRLLLRAGSRTEIKFAGETPLIYAARLARERIIEELVAGGSDIRAKDAKGMTALDHARRKRLSHRIQLLLGGDAHGPMRRSAARTR
jgi:uncharacterized protein